MASSSEGTSKLIEDAGEVITGARKDQWKDRTLSVADLEGMNEREIIKFVKKDQVFPVPDYQAIADAFNENRKALIDKVKAESTTEIQALDIGAGVALLVKKIRDSIQKPDESWGRLEYANYIHAVDRVRDTVLDPDRFRLGREVLTAAFGADVLTKIQSRIDTRSDNYHYLKLLGQKFMNTAQVTNYDFARAVIEADKKGFPGKQEIWQREYRVRSREELKIGSGHRYVGKEMVSAYFLSLPEQRFIGEFTSLQEAEAAISTLPPFMIVGVKTGQLLEQRSDTREAAIEFARELYQSKKQAVGRKTSTPELRGVVRTGTDFRDGRDVTPDDLVTHFGFRGVQFGNWTDQKDRQQSINHVFDAFMDLADVLKLHPLALSLNGELGLAFGARGSGSFAAHYECAQVVINLTKTSGAGSVAHEWAHALDDRMGRISGDVKPSTAFASHGVSHRSALPAEAVSALNRVTDAMAYRNKTQEEAITELTAKRDKSGRNIDSWLRGLRNDSKSIEVGSDTETEFNKLADSIRSGVGASDTEHQALLALVKQSEGRLPSKYYRGGLAGNLSYRGHVSKQIQEIESGAAEPGRTQSDFIRLSAVRGDYWGRKHELFARSFEAFVLDQVTIDGNRSDYLVHPGKMDKGITDPDWPYPGGEERATINTAMSGLLGVMRDTLHANVDLTKPWVLAREAVPEKPETVLPVIVEAKVEIRSAVSEETPANLVDAERAARDQGYDPCKADRKNGIYIGTVIALTNDYVIQDMGMRQAVLHSRSDVQSTTNVGELLDLRYRDGNVVTKQQMPAAQRVIRR